MFRLQIAASNFRGRPSDAVSFQPPALTIKASSPSPLCNRTLRTTEKAVVPYCPGLDVETSTMGGDEALASAFGVTQVTDPLMHDKEIL